MALVKHNDIESVWAQGFEPHNNPHITEYPVAVMTAKELSVVWSSDSRYWKWMPMFDQISCKDLEVAKLIEVCWLQVDGKYDAKKLIGKTRYAVDFVVELKDNLEMNGPVTLKLTRPDGSVQEHKEDLNKMPTNQWIGLRVGEFNNVVECGCDQIVKFSLNGNDGTTWKKGLDVVGAVIYPC